jgi:putative holliday junction resolvase
MGRVLAVDYGTKRIGLALSDPGRIIGSPFRTIINENRETAVRQIAGLCREEEVDHILLGYPLGRDGEPTAMSGEIDLFSRELAAATGLQPELSDERFTSAEAGEVLQKLGRTRRRRNRQERAKGTRDQVAAALLLQDWIQAHAG